jgi:hypothetical protein
VKRLIRDRGTKEFLTATGQWTRDHVVAQVFQSDEAVREARRAYRLQNCELYYLIGDEPSANSDFAVALERL